MKEFEFFGHLLSAEGAKPLSSYVEAIEKRPPPTTVKELQVFLGLVNFYRRFLPGVAVTLRPLTDALKGKRAANDKLAWSPEMEASFRGAKAALSRATQIRQPGSPFTWTPLPLTLGQLFTSGPEAMGLGGL